MNDPTDAGGLDAMFAVVPIIIAIGFVIVLGTIAYRMVVGARQWDANNKSPVLTRPMKLVTKRTDVHRSSSTHAGEVHTTGSTTTTYFATFEDAESGARREFRVSGREYGQLAEGDTGFLTFQGTRFQGFTRDGSVATPIRSAITPG